MGPYFLIVNPFQSKGFLQKWANDPQYRDPSLQMKSGNSMKVIRRDSKQQVVV